MKIFGQVPARIPAVPAARRRLWELDAALCCSVLGTCLSMPTLRKTVLAIEPAHSSLDDFAIHERAIRLAASRDTGRGINKVLDQAHDAAVRRFARAHDAPALTTLWNEAKRDGGIPGAYWALVSHRACTPELLKSAFGDVHMLSHLVGAANRADIRRLAELDAQNGELMETVKRQQGHIRELRSALEAMSRQMNPQIVDRIAGSTHAPMTSDLAASDTRTESQLDHLSSRLGREIAHREAVQRRLEAANRTLAEMRDALRRGQARLQLLELEITALESILPDASGARTPAIPRDELEIGSRTLLYVGARGTGLEKLRRFVEDRHATFVHHDGGLEDRTTHLPALVGRADWVVFPVDQVSHEAMFAVKRAARQQGKRYIPMRSASLASLVAALKALATNENANPSIGPG